MIQHQVMKSSSWSGQLIPLDRRLWTVEYAGPDGQRHTTVIAGVDESVVRYTLARYFPKVTVLAVTRFDEGGQSKEARS